MVVARVQTIVARETCEPKSGDRSVKFTAEVDDERLASQIKHVNFAHHTLAALWVLNDSARNEKAQDIVRFQT